MHCLNMYDPGTTITWRGSNQIHKQTSCLKQARMMQSTVAATRQKQYKQLLAFNQLASQLLLKVAILLAAANRSKLHHCCVVSYNTTITTTTTTTRQRLLVYLAGLVGQNLERPTGYVNEKVRRKNKNLRSCWLWPGHHHHTGVRVVFLHAMRDRIRSFWKGEKASENRRISIALVQYCR